MIYTALCTMFWMRAYPLVGEVGGGWALEFSSFLGPKWHSLIGLMPFHRAQKTLEFQGCKNHVAAGLSNRPVARSHIAVGAMGLPPLHFVCGGAGQLWIPRT